MKRGNLDYAFQTVVHNGGIGDVEHLVEGVEVGEQGRVDKQGGFQLVSGRVAQKLQFAVKVFEETVQMTGLADADAHEVFDVRRFGEGAEVEPDDGFFEPLAGVVGYGGGVGGSHAGILDLI